MRVSFCVPGCVYTAKSEEVVQISSELSLIDGWQYELAKICDFMDMQLVDQGVVGGTIRARWTPGKGLEVVTDYWMPDSLPASFIDLLRDETLAQLSDGIGEGGFEILLHGREYILVADTDGQPEMERVYDGKSVPAPSRIARSARDGDIALLEDAIDSGEAIDATIQGLTGLQLAIIYGHSECALLLIRRGANVNVLMRRDDESCLHLCALSRSLSDSESARVVSALLAHGADKSKKSTTGHTASSLAECRQKIKMLALLQ